MPAELAFSNNFSMNNLLKHYMKSVVICGSCRFKTANEELTAKS